MAKDLVEILTEAKQQIPPELHVMASMKSYPGSGSSGKYNSGKSSHSGFGGGGGGRY